MASNVALNNGQGHTGNQVLFFSFPEDFLNIASFLFFNAVEIRVMGHQKEEVVFTPFFSFTLLSFAFPFQCSINYSQEKRQV